MYAYQNSGYQPTYHVTIIIIVRLLLYYHAVQLLTGILLISAQQKIVKQFLGTGPDQEWDLISNSIVCSMIPRMVTKCVTLGLYHV